MRKHIYADNAATTKLDKEAFEAMIPWLTEEYANPSQPYSISRSAKQAVAEARAIIASCINAEPDEIYFTSGGSESDNWAIKGSAFYNTKRKTIVTSSFEHHAILRSCSSIEELGYPVAYISPNPDGYINPHKTESILSNNSALLSIMFANNELGTVQPIKKLASLAHKYGALFHTDAVQAVGHTSIDVKELNVDLLSASAHKFNGPKGIGFLYIKKGVQICSLINGGSQEFGHRAGTENVASIVGMASALKTNCDNLCTTKEYILSLENRFLAKIENTGLKYQINGGTDKLPGIINISFSGVEGEMILHRMDLMGICISTGSACDSVNTEISHVLKALQLDTEIAKGTIRISFGKNNTEAEVDKIIEALVKILA